MDSDFGSRRSSQSSSFCSSSSSSYSLIGLARSQFTNLENNLSIRLSTTGFRSVKMTGRGRIGDKWSMRILWCCVFGTAVGLYMVAVERQAQNRERMIAENFEALDSGPEEV